MGQGPRVPHPQPPTSPTSRGLRGGLPRPHLPGQPGAARPVPRDARPGVQAQPRPSCAPLLRGSPRIPGMSPPQSGRPVRPVWVRPGAPASSKVLPGATAHRSPPPWGLRPQQEAGTFPQPPETLTVPAAGASQTPGLGRLLPFRGCRPPPVLEARLRRRHLGKFPAGPAPRSDQGPGCSACSGPRRGRGAALCLHPSGRGAPAPGSRPPSGSQLGVSWPGGRAPIPARGGRHGISGHSSAQWPSHFSKSLLGWTLGPREAHRSTM